MTDAANILRSLSLCDQVEHLDTKKVRAIKLSLEPCKVMASDPEQPVQPDAEWKTYRRLNYGLKAAHAAGVPTVYEIGG